MTLFFDHFAVAGTSLEDASAHLEEALGVPLQAGGKHAHFATHNRLLGLGPFYIEAIAIDPAAKGPNYPRWFDLDCFAGKPRITNWICATTDMDGVKGACPFDLGEVLNLQRDELRWRFTNPMSGKLPFDGACPAVIDWGSTPHPAQFLTDQGCRLKRFVVQHPKAQELAAFFGPALGQDWLVLETGPEKAFLAEIETPHGQRSVQ